MKQGGEMISPMTIRERFQVGLARQLGHPDGLRGRILARGLNRGNRNEIDGAVDASGVRQGQRAADIGFGGGIGLRLLLERVGQNGHVDGVDVSQTMLSAARRTYRDATAAGCLTLQAGDLVGLPLETSSIDALITVNTIYFVDDLPRAVAELARVVRPTGRAVVGIADPAAMAGMPFTRHGFRLRPVDDVRTLLTDGGFAQVRHDRLGSGDSAYHLLVASR